MSNPENYTVGWICALPVEYVAAQEFLDEEHEKPSFVSPNDTNDYALGKIYEHNVVIAVLPDGEYGTASAANVATNLLNTFHNVRIGLMVGIGGGVPSKKHDVRLGDIVVSAPRGGQGGVFQYDFGKSIQDQEFQYTRFLNQPPAILRTAMTGIQAQYERKGHRLEEAINSILDSNRRLRQKYQRPESITDRLFQTTAIHETDCGATSCASNTKNLVLRRARSEIEDNPAIHYGLIASANQLMKDALIRDRLAAEKDVLCFEMEAAGLMNTFPCLVIRGICDYSDSHKNKEWQGYAAMVAAAYAKDLLHRIPLNRIEAEERISAIVSEELKGIQYRLDQAYSQHEQYYSEQKARVLTDQQQRCLQALKITNYEQQKNINPTPAEGTCQWALQSSEYTDWRKSNHNNLLWISADPGCGKSVLARSIVDKYLDAPDLDVVICYFFFKDNDEQNRVATALCSMLHQLFSERRDLLDHAVSLFEKNGDKLSQEVGELWRIFKAATSTSLSGKIVCIFDALDECCDDDRAQLIDNLSSFHSPSCSSDETSYLKFLVTSRPYDHIQEDFQISKCKSSYLRLKGEEENDVIRKEIDLVVKMRVKELAEIATLSSDIQQRLEHQLLQMEHRTYLWLHLALGDIRSAFKNSLRPWNESIQMIPASVNDAYKKILSRVPSLELDTVRKALQIIVAARRPLTITEMAIALGIATCLDSQTISEARLDASLIGEKLPRLCGLFVFVNNSKFYLIHQTAREFLIAETFSTPVDSIYPWTLSEAEAQIGSVCLRYLLTEDFEIDEERADSRAFLEYSAVHWPSHVRMMALNSESRTVNQLHRLYETGTKLWSLWFPIFWKAFDQYVFTPMLNSLHIAAFNGHEQVVDYLLEVDKSDINEADSTSTCPIMWASLNGHVKVVQMLLEKGADVNVQGGRYGNALQAACYRGHDKIAQMLLERGADVNAQGGRYRSALQAACSEGHDKIAQMLLEQGADVNAQGGKYGNALQAACYRGHDKIAQMLLEQGADVNAQGGEYGNALQAACYIGHDKIAQMLLDQGADVNAQGGEYGNALQAACYRGHDKIAQMLLDQGADVNAQGGEYGNALQAARQRGYRHIVQMLQRHNCADRSTSQPPPSKRLKVSS